MFCMVGIAQGFGELLIAGRTTDVLWGACALTADAQWVGPSGVALALGLDDDLMVPTVAEVVLVTERVD